MYLRSSRKHFLAAFYSCSSRICPESLLTFQATCVYLLEPNISRIFYFKKQLFQNHLKAALKMNIVVLKIILLVVMAVVAFSAGMVPMKLYDYLKRRSKAGNHSSLVVSLLSCFAGGVILGVCLLDMLPDAQ